MESATKVGNKIKAGAHETKEKKENVLYSLLLSFKFDVICAHLFNNYRFLDIL